MVPPVHRGRMIIEEVPAAAAWSTLRPLLMDRAALTASEPAFDSRPEVVEAHMRISLAVTRYWCARGADGEPVGLLSLDSKRFDAFASEAATLPPLLGVAVEVARGRGQAELRVNTGQRASALSALLERAGARSRIHPGVPSRWSPRWSDVGLLRRWASEEPPGYRFEVVDWTQDEAGLTRLEPASRLLFTSPRALLGQYRDIEQAGWTTWTAVALTPRGSVAAFSYVSLAPPPAAFGWQQLTVTVPRHRRRGLSRCLKSRLLARIVDERPDIERLLTLNGANRPGILALNRSLGFRPTERGRQWRITVDALERVAALG